ncbi:MAG: UbiA family prenyltransferase [Saprospiraceae bacterium]
MALARWFFQLFWIGVCATAMLWQTHLLLNTPAPSFWLCGFVFSATVFAYNFSAPPRRRWPAWGFGLLAGFCFLELTVVHQLTVFLPALIWLLYYDRYRPGQGTGLRDYPALKPVAIALAWAGVTVLLPVPLQAWTGAVLLFVGRAAFIFALALAYDLSDQPYDIRHGLNTLVLKIGPRQTFRLIDVALLLTALCAGAQVLLGIIALAAGIALCISLLFSAVAVRRVLARTGWPGWRKAGIDGLMVLQLLLIWISLILERG